MSIGITIATGILKFLDFTAWILTGGPFRLLSFNRPSEVINSLPNDDSAEPARERAGFVGHKPQCDWAPGVNTILDLVCHSVNTFPKKDALGVRTYLGMRDVGERFPVKQFGETVWITFEQVGNRLRAFGAYLRSIDNKAQPKTDIDNIQGACSLVIFEDTCHEWIIGALGAWSQDMVVTTVYGTLGPDAVAQAITEGNGTTVLCNRKNVARIVAHRAEMPTLKHIIYTNEQIEPEEAKKDLTGFEGTGLHVVSYEEAMETGSKVTEKYPMSKAKPDSVAVIMYTSGTTGKPKGVVIRHQSVVSTIASIVPIGTHTLPPHFTHLAYLPLAHIFEMCVHVGVLSMGARVGYADPRTLTQTGARPTGALEEFKPHLFMGVPKIYDVIMKGAANKMKKESPGKQQLVAAAFKWKAAAIEAGRYTPVFDALVFNKFKSILGGNVCLALSGGGPLASDCQEWVATAFGCSVVQGYGLTETCAGATLQIEGDCRPGVVGPPIPGNEIKLRSCMGPDDEPEVLDKGGLPYLTSDTKDWQGNDCLGRGEVLIRGPTVTDGYYKLPEKTTEAYLADGWFRTGDVAMWLPDGSLQIVDRVKNLVKLKGGEYIAMENMELVFGSSDYVDPVNGGIMTYGDGTMDRPVALVQVSEPNLKAWATANNVSFTSFDDLVRNPESVKEVLASLHACHKTGGLSPNEKLVAVGLVTDPWNAENKCLTGTNKISRHGVIARDGKLLDSIKM